MGMEFLIMFHIRSEYQCLIMAVALKYSEDPENFPVQVVATACIIVILFEVAVDNIQLVVFHYFDVVPRQKRLRGHIWSRFSLSYSLSSVGFPAFIALLGTMGWFMQSCPPRVIANVTR